MERQRHFSEDGAAGELQTRSAPSGGYETVAFHGSLSSEAFRFQGFYGLGERKTGLGQVKISQSSLLSLGYTYFFFNKHSLTFD